MELIPALILFLVIALLWRIEFFDPLGDELLQIVPRYVRALKSAFENINLGYYIPAGIPMHLGPCPEGSRDIAGSCWAGKDICDVELPVCTGGCNTSWDNCLTRVAGVCVPGPRTECTEIKCSSGAISNCPHITKFLTDRMTCGDKENVTGLCYDYCKPGYKKAPAAPYWCIPNFW